MAFRFCPDSELHIPNFSKAIRCNRKDRIGGGVAIYVMDSLHATKRQDLHVNSHWVEVLVNQRTLLVGGLYRPHDANNNQWLLLEQRIDQAFSQRCDNIIAIDDFNIDDSKSPSNKMSRLIFVQCSAAYIDTNTLHRTLTVTYRPDICSQQSACPLQFRF